MRNPIAQIIFGVIAFIGMIVGFFLGKKSNKNARKDGYREGQKDAKAEYSKKFDKLHKELEVATNRLKENKDLFNAKYAMYAVVCSYCNGKVSLEQRKEIEQFISGLSAIKLPKHINENIQKLYDNPPNIKEAFELAKKSGISMDCYDEIVNLMVNTDWVVHENKDAFLQAWNQLKAAA